MIPEGDFEVSFRRKPPGGGGDWGWTLIIGLALIVAMAAGIEGYFKTPSQPPSASTPSQRSQPAPISRPVEPETNFAPIGPQQYPSPSPDPIYLTQESTSVLEVYWWRDRRWLIPRPPANRYAYLCLNNGLTWCFRNPPNQQAHACTQRPSGLQGWCW